MNCIRFIFISLLIVLFLIRQPITVSAVSTGFATENLTAEEQNDFLKNVNITMLQEAPPKKTIECFDVNEDHMIAIGCMLSNEKTIAIYTSDGNYEYGYRFQCNGTFGVEWDGNTVIILFVRSDIAVAVSPAGEIENVLRIKNTTENNSYWNNTVFSTSRKIESTEYFTKNDMGILGLFASSYSQLVAKQADGRELVLYDVNEAHSNSILAGIICFLVFVGTVVSAIVWWSFRNKNRTQGDGPSVLPE